MEKLVFKPYDKEHMRMAMLKHEETFKQQVYELHRLYQIQKILMKNMKSQSTRVQAERISVLDLERRPAEKYNIIRSDESDGGDEIIDESEIELTLGPTSYNNNNRRRKTAEAPMNSDSGPSFSSSSTGSSHMNRRTSSRRETTRKVELNGGCQLGHTTSFGYQVATKDNNDEELRLKHPPWLFQVLSLNMT